MTRGALALRTGKEFRFKPPSGLALPKKAYESGADTYQAPPADSSKLSVSPAGTGPTGTTERASAHGPLARRP